MAAIFVFLCSGQIYIMYMIWHFLDFDQIGTIGAFLDSNIFNGTNFFQRWRCAWKLSIQKVNSYEPRYYCSCLNSWTKLLDQDGGKHFRREPLDLPSRGLVWERTGWGRHFYFFLLFPLIVLHFVAFPTGDRLLRAGNCGAKILRQTQAGEEDNAGNNNASETLLWPMSIWSKTFGHIVWVIWASTPGAERADADCVAKSAFWEKQLWWICWHQVGSSHSQCGSLKRKSVLHISEWQTFKIVVFPLQGNQRGEEGETEQRFRQSCRGGEEFRVLKISTERAFPGAQFWSRSVLRSVLWSGVQLEVSLCRCPFRNRVRLLAQGARASQVLENIQRFYVPPTSYNIFQTRCHGSNIWADIAAVV